LHRSSAPTSAPLQARDGLPSDRPTVDVAFESAWFFVRGPALARAVGLEDAAMFDPTTLVGFHTWMSLIALGTGFVVTAGLLGGRSLPGWTGVFLATAVATSVTGFPLPAPHFLPSHAVGILALASLAVAIVARYPYRMAGAWRWIYVVTAVANVYLLAFVGVVQAFLKVPALHALAPTGSEPPFAVTQLLVLVLFAALTVAAAKLYRPTPTRKAYA
jgi:hypothetical protein